MKEKITKIHLTFDKAEVVALVQNLLTLEKGSNLQRKTTFTQLTLNSNYKSKEVQKEIHKWLETKKGGIFYVGSS